MSTIPYYPSSFSLDCCRFFLHKTFLVLVLSFPYFSSILGGMNDVRFVKDVVSIIKQIKERYDEVVKENRDFKISRAASLKDDSIQYESKDKPHPPNLSSDEDDIPPHFFEMMVERLKKENYDLMSEIEEQRTEIEHLKRMTPPVSKVAETNPVLSLSPSSLPYIEELKDLRQIRSDLTKDLQRMKKENGVLYFEIKEMGEKMKEKTDEVETLTFLNKQLSKDRNKMKGKLEYEISSRKSGQTRSVSGLESQLGEEAEHRLENQDEAVVGEKLNSRQIFEMEKKNKELQEQVNKYILLADQKDETLQKSLEKYNELQMENQRMGQELEEGKEKFKSALEEKDLQISTLNDTLEISSSQQFSINLGFDSDEEENPEGGKQSEKEWKKTVEEQSTTSQDLERKLTEYEEQDRSAVEELKKMKSGEISQNLVDSKDISSSMKESDDIRLGLEDDVHNWKKKFEDVSEMYESLKSRNDDLEEENIHLSMKVEEGNIQDNGEEQKKTLEKEIEKLRTSFEEVTEVSNDLTLEQEVLRSKNEDLEGQNSTLIEENNSLLKKHDQLLISHQEVTQKLKLEEEKNAKGGDWKEKYEEAKKSLEEQEMEREYLRKENNQLTEEFTKLTGENETLEKKIEEMSKKSSSSSSSSSQLDHKKEVEELTKQNLEMVERVKTLESELEQKKDELLKTTRKCENLKELNDTLESKLFSEEEAQQKQRDEEEKEKEEELKKVEELEKDVILKDSLIQQQKELVEELEEELEKTKNAMKPPRNKLQHRRTTSVVSYNGPDEEVESLQQRVNLLTEQLQRYISPTSETVSDDDGDNDEEEEKKKEVDGVRFIFNEATKEKNKQEIIIPRHHPMLNYLVYTKDNDSESEINLTEIYSREYKLCDFQSHLLFFDFLLSQQQQMDGTIEGKEEEEEEEFELDDTEMDESASLADLLLEESFGGSEETKQKKNKKKKKKKKKKTKVTKLKELESRLFDEEKLLSRRELEDWEYDYIDEVIAFHQTVQKKKSKANSGSLITSDDDDDDDDEEEEEGEMKSSTGSLKFLIPFLKLTERVVTRNASRYMTFIFLYYLSEEIELELSELCGGDQFLQSYTVQTLPSTQKLGVSYDDFNDLIANEYQILRMESRDKMVFLDCFSERHVMKKIILSCLNPDDWDDAILQNFGETLLKINRGYVQSSLLSQKKRSRSRKKKEEVMLSRDDLEVLRVQLKCVFDNHEMESFTFFFFYELESELEIQEIQKTQLAYLFDKTSLLSSYVQPFVLCDNKRSNNNNNDDDDDDDDEGQDENDGVHQFVVCLELRNTQSRESAGRIVRDGLAPLLQLTRRNNQAHGSSSRKKSRILKVKNIECQCEMDEYRPHLISNLESKKNSLRKTVEKLQKQIYSMNQHKILQEVEQLQQQKEVEDDDESSDDDGFSSFKREIMRSQQQEKGVDESSKSKPVMMKTKKKGGGEDYSDLNSIISKTKNCMTVLEDATIELSYWRSSDDDNGRQKKKEEEEDDEGDSDEESDGSENTIMISKEKNPRIFEWVNRFFIRHRKEAIVENLILNPMTEDDDEEEEEGEGEERNPPEVIRLRLPLTMKQIRVLSSSGAVIEGSSSSMNDWLNEIIPSLPMIRSLGFWETFPPKDSLITSFYETFVPFLLKNNDASMGDNNEIENALETLGKHLSDPDWIQFCYYIGNVIASSSSSPNESGEDDENLRLFRLFFDRKLLSSSVVMRYYIKSGFLHENDRFRNLLAEKSMTFVPSRGETGGAYDVSEYPLFISISIRCSSDSVMPQFLEYLQKVVSRSDAKNNVELKSSALDKVYVTISVHASRKEKEQGGDLVEVERYPLDEIMEKLGRYIVKENRQLLKNERIEVLDVNVLDRHTRRRKEELLNQCKVYQNLYTNRLSRFQEI